MSSHLDTHGTVERPSTIHTVGHGTRTTEELVGVVKRAGVETIVDVRRFPGSRRNPHLTREELGESLPKHGIAYDWRGEELGGRRSRASGESRHPAWRNTAFRAYADFMETETFRFALNDLIARANDGEMMAVMCAETLWWRCHRRLIADAPRHGVAGRPPPRREDGSRAQAARICTARGRRNRVRRRRRPGAALADRYSSVSAGRALKQFGHALGPCTANTRSAMSICWRRVAW